MATVPRVQETDSFSHEEANCPFAIETAVYDSGNNELDVSVGQGRYDFGNGTIFEQTATTITSFAAPAASTTYYVYIDYNGGSPQVTIKTGSTASRGQIRIGTVTTDGAKEVSATSDLRGLLPPAPPFTAPNGSASNPSYGFQTNASGMYHSGSSLRWSYNGTAEMELTNTQLQPATDVAIDLGSSSKRFHEGFFRDWIYVWDKDDVQHQFGQDSGGNASGLWVRTLSNPPSGGAIFGVQSGGHADRFVVDHGAETLHASPSGTICSRFLASVGTGTAGFAFNGDTDTGLFRTGTNQVSLRAGNTNVLTVSSNQNTDIAGNLVMVDNHYVGDSLARIWFERSGTLDTVRIDTNDLFDIDVGGSLRGRWDANGLQVNVEGNRTTPSISFNDPDVGFFHDGSLNRLGFTNDLGSSSSWYSTMIMSATQLVPGRDNVADLGNSTFRWDEIWATDSNIHTSDIDTKEEIEDDDLGLAFIRALRPIKYVRKGANHSRPHYGFGAQDVKRAMDRLGVEDFAGYIDPAVKPPDPELWPEAYDADGNLLPERNTKGLRIGEFIGPMAKAIQELADRLDALESA